MRVQGLELRVVLPLACQLGSDRVPQVPKYSSCMATLSISGYTPPYPRNDSSEHKPTTLVLRLPVQPASTRVHPRPPECNPRNTRPTPPPASAGFVATLPPPRVQPCTLHRTCESAGLGADGSCSGRAATRVAVGGGRMRCGGRQLVWV